jgi:hypothetical protein
MDMKKMITMALVLLGTTVFAAGGSKWVCIKEEKELKVTGSNVKEKKSNCEKQSGVWGEMVSGNAPKEPLPEVQKQTSGGGGGW